jgi:hypothetical protein
MKRIVVFLFLIVLAFTLALRADTETTYDITFTCSGTIPTSGSFTYDSTVPQFSKLRPRLGWIQLQPDGVGE